MQPLTLLQSRLTAFPQPPDGLIPVDQFAALGLRVPMFDLRSDLSPIFREPLPLLMEHSYRAAPAPAHGRHQLDHRTEPVACTSRLTRIKAGAT